MSAPLATLGNRYRIERELGRGGMATVYLADDLKHGRRVAVKVLRNDVAAAIGHDRFLREIEIAARLTHPHILPLFDSGAADGRVYYVMPFIEGGSLRDRLNRERQLGLEEALRLTREVASALDHAHQHGLIHRDVKPENLLLADGIPLVADFGIARSVPAEPRADDAATAAWATSSGTLLGTPQYMAPEQTTGAGADPRADQYALACVLYEMLAGVPPFVAPTGETLLRLHLTALPRPVNDLRPNVPGPVAAALSRALEKLPADRFASMSRFAEALLLDRTSTPTPLAGDRPVTTPHNLPRQRTRFIGREKELAECARVLAETRLLTLSGVGGSGKTRLALRLAESLLDTYPDGVWFVDLASVESDSLVAQVTASSVGAKVEASERHEDAVIRSLAGLKCLLVLDNVEHLLRSSAELADRLLGALPDLKVLATGREGLGIDGERLFAVKSLTLPAAGADPDPENLLRYEAVRLFATRAREADPEFVLAPANGRIVADICRRLDGIPLALELAAARVRVLSVEQIAHMLDDRFRLLTGGSRSSLERHRTLRATVQWSYDHLAPDEQELFVSLSAFTGGWTLEAAACLAGADEFQVLDRLTGLIDKSLVVTERVDGSPVRYRMLETLRQFGVELLAESGRADAVRAAHLEYFLAWVSGLREDLRRDSEVVVLHRVQADEDNLRGALTWGFQHEPERAVLLTERLSRLWFVPGYYSEGRGWFAETLNLGDAVPPRRRAAALSRSGRLAFLQGDYEAGLAFYGEETVIQNGLGNKSRMAAAMLNMANIYSYRREPESTHALLDRVRAIYTELDDRAGMARLDMTVGLVGVMGGLLAEARRCFDRALAYSEGAGDLTRVQVGLGNLAIVDVLEGHPAVARERLRECMRINRETENAYGVANDLPALIEIYRLEGEPKTAARLVGAAEALLMRIEASLEAIELDLFERATASLRSELGDRVFETERLEGRSLSLADVAAMA